MARTLDNATSDSYSARGEILEKTLRFVRN